MKTRTSFREKLHKPQAPKIVPVPLKMQKTCGTGTMLIPRPLDVDALIREVPRGRVITMGELRNRLARDAGADTACPLCVGIFVSIAAEAAEEDRAAGRKRITPYWRVVRNDGSMNPKFSGGAEAQRGRLQNEKVFAVLSMTST